MKHLDTTSRSENLVIVLLLLLLYIEWRIKAEGARGGSKNEKIRKKKKEKPVHPK
jgi:hypothetical protein